MKIMRDFVTDVRLHRALDEVESWLGYEIKAIPMPEWKRIEARCTMNFDVITKKFELWYIEDEPQSQSVYCHELAHAVLLINGQVVKYDFIDPIPMILMTIPINHFLDQIWKYMQHIPVFIFVKELYYDEVHDYAPVVAGLIGLIRQNQLFNVMNVPSFDPLKDQMRCQVGALVQGLALPMAEETRDDLRNIALERLPQSLELADAILSALGTRTLLGPQEYQEYLLEIYRIVGLPIGNLLFSFLDRTCLNFRSRILEAAKF
jgi:hypothetical protein